MWASSLLVSLGKSKRLSWNLESLKPWGLWSPDDPWPVFIYSCMLPKFASCYVGCKNQPIPQAFQQIDWNTMVRNRMESVEASRGFHCVLQIFIQQEYFFFLKEEVSAWYLKMLPSGSAGFVLDSQSSYTSQSSKEAVPSMCIRNSFRTEEPKWKPQIVSSMMMRESSLDRGVGNFGGIKPF